MIQKNQCKMCPLVSITAMKKKSRGLIDYITDNEHNIMLYRWMDNFVVTIATTRQVSQAFVLVKCFSQKEKKKVEIPCPKIVQEYNKFMGDYQDQNLKKYKISLCRKKWYWSIFM